MMPVKMFVFGAPRLVRAERAVEQIGRKALGLLVYLAVTGQPHSRDALAALFWPEARSGQARTNLRTLLHRLAQALGSDLLEAGADTSVCTLMLISGWIVPPSGSTRPSACPLHWKMRWHWRASNI